MNWEHVVQSLSMTADKYFTRGFTKVDPVDIAAQYVIGSICHELAKALYEGHKNSRVDSANDATVRDGEALDIQRP